MWNMTLHPTFGTQAGHNLLWREKPWRTRALSLAAHAPYLLQLQPGVSIPGCLHLRSWHPFPRGVCRGSLFRRRSRKPDCVLFTLTQHPGLSLSYSHPGVLPEPLVRDLLTSLNTPSVCVDPPAPRRCATARRNERMGYVSSTLSPAGAPQ